MGVTNATSLSRGNKRLRLRGLEAHQLKNTLIDESNVLQTAAGHDGRDVIPQDHLLFSSVQVYVTGSHLNTIRYDKQEARSSSANRAKLR